MYNSGSEHFLIFQPYCQNLSKPFPKQALVFMCQLYMSFENTEAKGELAYDEQFLLFP